MALLDDYLEYLKSTEGKSTGTIGQYKNSMNLFISYMKKDKFSLTRNTMSKIKISDIYGFLGSISETNSGASRRNKISALKSFFEYCKEIELIKHNIILDIKKQPKTPKRIPKYFNIEECKHLIECIGKRNYIRNRMIIVLFLNTGFRLAELISLDMSFVNNADSTIIGKGDKERIVCLNPKVVVMLKEYLEQRPKSKSELNALFLNERGTRIGSSGVQNILRTTIKKAGLNPEGKGDVLVHVLRHSFASNLYQSGTDTRTLQVILGHGDISSTQIYTHTSKEQIQNVAKNSVMQSII